MHEQSIAGLEALVDECRSSGDQARLAGLLHDLGNTYEDASDLRQAESSFRSALELGAVVYGDHTFTAVCKTRLARVLSFQGKHLDEAEELARDALEILRASEGSKWHNETLFYLGVVLRRSGKASEAEVVLTEALERTERLRGRQDGHWALCAYTLFLIARDTGQLARAAELYEEVARVTSDRDMPILLQDGALLRQRMGDHDAAMALFEEAIALLTPDPTRRPELAAVLQDYSGLLHALGDREGAAELALQAAELRR
jgi:tetratricopeptide (TPR) repeat protein